MPPSHGETILAFLHPVARPLIYEDGPTVYYELITYLAEQDGRTLGPERGPVAAISDDHRLTSGPEGQPWAHTLAEVRKLPVSEPRSAPPAPLCAKPG